MKDIDDLFKSAFPWLGRHPQLTAFLILVFAGLSALPWLLRMSKTIRKRLFLNTSSRLIESIDITSRWLYVYKPSRTVNDWKYYTSETSGGKHGDDIIWRMVDWPKFKPKDTLVLHGVVGTVQALEDSQSKLEARWGILHDPETSVIGMLPARGVRSRLRRITARVFFFLGRI